MQMLYLNCFMQTIWSILARRKWLASKNKGYKNCEMFFVIDSGFSHKQALIVTQFSCLWIQSKTSATTQSSAVENGVTQSMRDTQTRLKQTNSNKSVDT